MSDWRRLRTGDVLVGVSLLALVFAALLPTMRARAFRGLVDRAVADVETLRSSARSAREIRGDWPPPAPLGIVPEGISGAFSEESGLTRDGYALRWTVWERVERAPVPGGAAPLPADADAVPDSVRPATMEVIRQVPAVEVHSGNPSLLAELLRRYGREASFVRDSIWTVLADAPAPAPPGDG